MTDLEASKRATVRRGEILAAEDGSAPDSEGSSARGVAALRVGALTVGGLTTPVTVDQPQPQFGWRLDGRGADAVQTAYQVRVHRVLPNGERFAVWDSGRQEGVAAARVHYSGDALEPLSTYESVARVWDGAGRVSDWSPTTYFSTGLIAGGSWSAGWIGAPEDLRVASGAQRVFTFRRTVTLPVDVVAARLVATALGVYVAEINGHNVPLGELAPGWTDYRARLYYQDAPVEHLLQAGDNELQLTVADGWWAGHIAWWGRQIYGDRTAVSAALHLTLADGTEQVVTTDGSWTVALSWITECDLVMGEHQDLRLRDVVGQRLDGVHAEVVPPPDVKVEAEPLQPIAAQSRVPAMALTGTSRGTIVDFGQHLTGRVELRVRGREGAVVRVRHGEALSPDGSLYTASLRTAKQENRFILSSRETQTLTPKFAVQGFRYAEILGHDEPIDRSDVVAVVFHSGMALRGWVRSGNPLFNQVQHNVVWSARSNFIGIPVDCSQRDERLGWTGDINLFARTALMNFECEPFLRSWLRALADGQRSSGSIPDVAPYVVEPLPPRDVGDGQPGWGDAIVGVPWEIYLASGDAGVLQELWPAMVRWVEYLVTSNPSLVRPDGTYGDWNAPGGGTPDGIVGTAWFARTLRQMAAIADILGEDAAGEEYRALLGEVRAAFGERFVASDGAMPDATQTAYAVALDAGLLPDEAVGSAVSALVEDLRHKQWRMTTGFVGTARLLPVLSAHDHADIAYRLALSQEFPSWGYQAVNGATTVWEHWDAWHPDRGFQNPAMNSFNHFTLATVGEWFFQTVAGIAPDVERPGYRHVRFRPLPSTRLREVHARYRAPSGEIESSWWTDGVVARMSVTVPANTSGALHLPWVGEAAEVEVLTGAGARVETSEEGVVVDLDPGQHVVLVPARPEEAV